MKNNQFLIDKKIFDFKPNSGFEIISKFHPYKLIWGKLLYLKHFIWNSKKPSLWSKFPKWLASKFTCFGKGIQEDIQEHVEGIGEEILAPTAETGVDILEDLVN